MPANPHISFVNASFVLGQNVVLNYATTQQQEMWWLDSKYPSTRSEPDVDIELWIQRYIRDIVLKTLPFIQQDITWNFRQ